jgi:hypothetical protein
MGTATGMRSLSQQQTAELGGTLSILTRQKHDHERLDRLLNDLAGRAVGQEQEEVLHRIARLVFPHAFAEESVLWTMLDRSHDALDSLARRSPRLHGPASSSSSGLASAAGRVEQRGLLQRGEDSSTKRG